MRVLVVEDSPRLRNYLQKALQKVGYSVDLASDGEEGLWLAQSNPYDVIVLDLMLPVLDGLSVLRQLRDGGCDTHVLILTAKDTVEERVDGLHAGADDYLIKPFAMEELLARVHTLIRRGHGLKSSRLTVGSLELDTVKREVRKQGVILELTPREYALLEFLTLRRGATVSRTEIEQHIYDDQVEPMSNVVDSAICLLRKKIDIPGQSSLIRTRRGMGYVLETTQVC